MNSKNCRLDFPMLPRLTVEDTMRKSSHPSFSNMKNRMNEIIDAFQPNV